MSYPIGDSIANLQAPPIQEFHAWIKTDSEGQMVLWPGVMKRSPRFFDSLRAHAVPLDGRALAALKHSALALELDAWLGHRLCRIRKSDSVRVSWTSLKDQFGGEHPNPKDFKKEVRAALRHTSPLSLDTTLRYVYRRCFLAVMEGAHSNGVRPRGMRRIVPTATDGWSVRQEGRWTRSRIPKIIRSLGGRNADLIRFSRLLIEVSL